MHRGTMLCVTTINVRLPAFARCVRQHLGSPILFWHERYHLFSEQITAEQLKPSSYPHRFLLIILGSSSEFDPPKRVLPLPGRCSL